MIKLKDRQSRAGGRVFGESGDSEMMHPLQNPSFQPSVALAERELEPRFGGNQLNTLQQSGVPSRACAALRLGWNDEAGDNLFVPNFPQTAVGVPGNDGLLGSDST